MLFYVFVLSFFMVIVRIISFLSGIWEGKVSFWECFWKSLVFGRKGVRK